MNISEHLCGIPQGSFLGHCPFNIDTLQLAQQMTNKTLSYHNKAVDTQGYLAISPEVYVLHNTKQRSNGFRGKTLILNGIDINYIDYIPRLGEHIFREQNDFFTILVK